MLTKFAAALLATSLIAGSAIAAQPSGMRASNGTAPAVQTQTPSTPAANTAKPAVKHAARHRNHVRKHIARSKGHVEHHARHAKPAKTHQAGMSKGLKRS
jgi:uncharacterized protein YdeI (BOF family)